MLAALNNFTKATFSSLQVRNYRLYFIGQGISMCGTWMQSIGQAWLVLKITGSGTALGLVTAFQFLPVLLLGPMGGVVTDRFPKRKLLYFTQTAFSLLALTLGILVAVNRVQLWMVYLLALGFGLLAAIDNPTRQSFVHEMVGSQLLRNAVTLNSTAINLARVIGPALAGALIAGVGLASCFIINSVSYLAVLICLLMMRDSELNAAPPIRAMKGQLLKGFAYMWKTPVIRDILIMMAIVGTLAYEFQVSLPLLAKYTFHGTAASFAMLTSAMGMGAVLGGLFSASRGRSRPVWVAWASLAFGTAILIVSLSPGLSFAAIALVAVGIFSILFTSLGNTTLQLECQPAMRGRVMAIWTVAFMGSTPIGGPIIGWVGEHASPRWSLVVGGLAALLAGAYGLMSIRKNYSKINPAAETAQDGQ
jgi:MFS family permease